MEPGGGWVGGRSAGLLCPDGRGVAGDDCVSSGSVKKKEPQTIGIPNRASALPVTHERSAALVLAPWARALGRRGMASFKVSPRTNSSPRSVIPTRGLPSISPRSRKPTTEQDATNPSKTSSKPAGASRAVLAASRAMKAGSTIPTHSRSMYTSTPRHRYRKWTTSQFSPPRVLPDDMLSLARKVFDTLDRDASGTISAEDLGFMMRNLGKNPSPEELKAFMVSGGAIAH